MEQRQWIAGFPIDATPFVRMLVDRGRMEEDLLFVTVTHYSSCYEPMEAMNAIQCPKLVYMIWLAFSPLHS